MGIYSAHKQLSPTCLHFNKTLCMWLFWHNCYLNVLSLRTDTQKGVAPTAYSAESFGLHRIAAVGITARSHMWSQKKKNARKMLSIINCLAPVFCQRKAALLIAFAVMPSNISWPVFPNQVPSRCSELPKPRRSGHHGQWLGIMVVRA